MKLYLCCCLFFVVFLFVVCGVWLFVESHFPCLRFYDEKIEFLHSKLTASESIPLATKTFSDSLIRPSVTEKLTSVPKPFEISFDHKV